MRNVEAYIDDMVVKSKNMGICLTTSERHSTISISTRCVILKTCVQCIIRKTARLHGIIPENLREPD
jgi:hypothetical protein